MFAYKDFWENYNWWASPPEWIDKIKPHIIGESILDIGCNDGRFIPLFLNKKKYVGCDLNKVAIKEAKRKYPELEFILGDICDYDFKKNKFDIIFSCTVLMTIVPEKIEKLVKQMRACSKHIVLIEPTIPSLIDHGFMHDYKKLFNIVYKEKVEHETYLMVHKN